MYILGVAGGPNTLSDNYIDDIMHVQYHDSSVALLRDGDLVFALEEERLTRIKHTNCFPKNAIRECLLRNHISCRDIDHIAFAIGRPTLGQLSSRLGKNQTVFDPESLLLQDIFKKHTGYELDRGKIKLYSHHYCHAASAFFQSGFESSLVVTLDGMGDGLSGSAYIGEGNKLELVRELGVEKSLGHFYLRVTEFLGMNVFDEYKVMGLAPYGNTSTYKDVFDKFYTLYPDGDFVVNFDELHLLRSICPKRIKGEEFNQKHKDIAASLQFTLEVIVSHLITWLKEQTGQSKICLAGGVALNCKLTGELLHAGLFTDMFVFPASGDNGLSVGAVLACQLEQNAGARNRALRSVSLGVDYSASEIERELDRWKAFVSYEKCENVAGKASSLIARGEVIGWFCGKEEYGPRALGNRSILADPRPAENKDRINAIIKMREGFRPFAPAILEERVGEYFQLPANGKRDYPFMTFILKAKEQYRTSLGAVVHADGTARIQTVSQQDNFKFWKLIAAFFQETGVPVLLNTSFNNNYEPIVHAPDEAIAFLLTSDVNYVVIEDFLIKKKMQGHNEGMFITVSLLEHFALYSPPGGTGHFIRDLYMKYNKEISETLWNRLSQKTPFNYTTDELDGKEVFSLWRQRFIKVAPHTKALRL